MMSVRVQQQGLASKRKLGDMEASEIDSPRDSVIIHGVMTEQAGIKHFWWKI